VLTCVLSVLGANYVGDGNWSAMLLGVLKMHAAPMHTLPVQQKLQRRGQSSHSVALGDWWGAVCCRLIAAAGWVRTCVTPRFSIAPILLPVNRSDKHQHTHTSVSVLQPHNSSTPRRPAPLTSQVDLIVAHTVHVLWAAADEFCREPARQPWPQAACWPSAGGARCVHVLLLSAGCCCL
jgi:hypothetical protein